MADRLLQFFEYKHLPAHLQTVSKQFHDLAHSIVGAQSVVPVEQLLNMTQGNGPEVGGLAFIGAGGDAEAAGAVPGIGPVIATCLTASVSDAKLFEGFCRKRNGNR